MMAAHPVPFSGYEHVTPSRRQRRRALDACLGTFLALGGGAVALAEASVGSPLLYLYLAIALYGVGVVLRASKAGVTSPAPPK